MCVLTNQSQIIQVRSHRLSVRVGLSVNPSRAVFPIVRHFAIFQGTNLIKICAPVTVHPFTIIQSLDALDLVQTHCREGDVWYVKAAMVEFGVDAVLNARAIRGWTCLMDAAERGRNDLVSLLLGNGVEVDQRNGNQQTALLRAARSGHANTTKILLDAGAEVDARDDLRLTPMHASAMQ